MLCGKICILWKGERTLLKQALSSIKIIFMNAKIPAGIKILQSILAAVLTPLSIFFTQNLINSIESYVKGTADIWRVALFMSLLLVSLLFDASNGFFDNILNISLKRNVNKNLTSTVVDKFRRLEYQCFEDKEVADTINRMGGAPHEKSLIFFLPQ